MKNLIRKISCLLCTVLMITMLVPSAFASDGRLTVRYEQENVVFHIYHIASRNADHSWEMTSQFAPYKVDLNSPDQRSAAAVLAGYVSRDKLRDTASGKILDGAVVFRNLEHGMYLVVGEQKTIGGYIFTPVPFLVEVTNVNMVVDSKGDQDKVPEPDETVDCTVVKIWEGEEPHPDSVVVQLLKNGQVYDEVVLNAANGWSHIWTELDPAFSWQVVEKQVPDGYTVTVDRNGWTFEVVNTEEEPYEPPVEPPVEPPTIDPVDPPLEPPVDPHVEPPVDPPVELPVEPETPKLPQTGQLWWPAAVLGAAGIGVLMAGLVLRRKDGHES